MWQNWDWVQNLSKWITDTFYDAGGRRLEPERGMGHMDRLCAELDWVQNLSKWITDTFYDAEEGVWSLKRAWGIWT